MKTTVDYKSVKYTQDGNTVICDLVSEVRYDKVKHMEFFIDIPDVYAYIKKIADSKGNIVLHTRGVAKCLPTDTFDFETGRRIAYTRAQSEVFYKAADIYDEIIRRLEIDIDSVAINCYFAGHKCSQHIDDLIEGTNNE